MTYLPQAQQTPWQQSEGLNLSKTAVLVIDVLGGEGGVVPGLETMAENAVRIVKAAREKGLPVVFLNDAHLLGIDKELELWGEHGICGSDAAQPLKTFDLQESDFIIPKRRYNGFFQTDLSRTFRNGNEHDVHNADTADEQGDARNPDELRICGAAEILQVLRLL